MSALPHSQKMSEAEYLEFERASETKHEFLNGEVFDMAGASREHNLIAGSTYASLYSQTLDRNCEVYQSDMRLKVKATGLLTYPDITVVCGKPELTTDALDTLVNPQVIIEVLSPTTEAYDRGKKFKHYSQIASLQEYVLISQDTPRIERFLRQEVGKWEYEDVRALEGIIELSSIEYSLKLADVYKKIVFTDEETKDES
jgi:Uma2 family endonuclease